MPSSFYQVASSTLSLPPDSYIYSICPLSRPSNPGSTSSSPRSYAPSASTHSIRNGGTVSVISSDNSLRIVQVTQSSFSLQAVIPNTHGGSADGFEGVTAQCRVEDDLNADSQLVATAGRDGVVKFWDVRTGSKTPSLQMHNPNRMPLSVVECSTSRNLVAAGTELPDRGPGDSSIFLWDPRSPSAPHTLYNDSHTDTITSLAFHPTGLSPLLLSGSTDSLVNLFDTSKQDEDEALLQVFNHRSAVHQAGFMSPETVFVLGTDETLSFYRSVTSAAEADSDQKGPDPVELGDLRQHLHRADYIANLSASSANVGKTTAGQSNFLAAGSFSDNWLDLVPLSPVGDPRSSLNWSIHSESKIRIAHGDELVRDVYAELSDDVSRSVILTCGEDSHLRLWAPTPQDAKAGKQKTARDGKQLSRFTPY